MAQEIDQGRNRTCVDNDDWAAWLLLGKGVQGMSGTLLRARVLGTQEVYQALRYLRLHVCTFPEPGEPGQLQQNATPRRWHCRAVKP